jgi:hypothetical protein
VSFDPDTSCTGYAETGPEVLYAFTPTATARYTFTLVPTGWDGAVYVLDGCPQVAPATGCLAGGDRELVGETETVSAPMYQGHTYFVGVDGYTATAHGAYTLTASPGVPLPPGDNCASPLPLTVGAGVTGDTTDASDDVELDGAATSCPDSLGQGNDLVYTFTPPASGRYTFTLTSTGTARPVLYVVPSCVKGAVSHCLGGHAPDKDGVPATATLSLSSGRDYTVVVDGASGDMGPFTLEVEAAGAAPANDSCTGTPTPLAVGVTAYGDLSQAAADLDPGAASTCTGEAEPGEDVVYAFTPFTAGLYTFLVKSVDAAESPSLYVMDSCPESSPAISCVAGVHSSASGPLQAVSATLSAGTPYFVVVDSPHLGWVHGYELQVLKDGQPNDTCSSAIAVLPGHSYVGDTTSLTDDLSPTRTAPGCTGYIADGPDAVYLLTAPAAGRYTLTLTPLTSDDDVSLYVLASCPGAAFHTVNACVGGADQAGQGKPETLTVALAAGESVTVVVDGYAASSKGPYTLEVAEAPPAPAGDTCADAQPLASHDASAPPEVLTGSLADAAGDATSSCAAAGKDLVYALDLTERVSFTAALLGPDGGAVDGALHLNTGCTAGGADELACAAADAGPLQVPRLGELTGGTYYLWVEGTAAQAGDFTLQVTLGPPGPPPTGDLCTDALPLPEATTTVGDLAGFANDYAPTDPACGQSAPQGEDVVYAFTPSTTGYYEVTVTPDATLHGALYVLDGCPADGGAPACLGGADDRFVAGAPAHVRLPLVAGQTYQVVVDSHPGDRGGFTLDAAPVALLSGDFCGALQPRDALVLAPLADGGQALTLPVDLTGYGNDAHSNDLGGCGGVGLGGDQVFELNLPAPVAGLTVTLAPTSSALSPVLHVRQGPCSDTDVTTELGCDATLTGATVHLGPQPAGPLFIWADSYEHNEGPGVLSVTVP